MNEHIEKVREAVDARREQHTQGEIREGKPADAIVADEPAGHSCAADHFAYYGGHLVAESVSAANRRRIIACWNATLGFPTTALEERGFLGSINEACDARVALADALRDALEYVEQHEDADCVDGRFQGNAAMDVASRIRDALEKHAVKEPAHG